jgi:hypothetical protein
MEPALFDGQLSATSFSSREINNIRLTVRRIRPKYRMPLRNRWWIGVLLSGKKFNPDAVSIVAKVIDSLC